MTERTLPTNTCSKCGQSMGLSHQCGLEQDVEIKPDIIETIFTPESIVKCLRELADVWKTNVQDGIVCMVAADTIDQQADQIKELRENAAFYCPTCKRHAHTIDKDGFHKCHTKVVPMWSEERRKVYRLENRLLAIEKALKGGA